MTTSLSSSSPVAESSITPVEFAWLEITPSCQLRCLHCYASSRPGLGHGQMSAAHWKDVMTSLVAHGTRFVQFIGGEPTIHPYFCELLGEAGRLGLGIEVYSNLVSITARMWELFTRYQVRLATSFYSDVPAVHDAITMVDRSQQKTLANIQKALALGLRVRVGIVRVSREQDIAATKRLLIESGVEAERIGVDRTRGVGRGAHLLQEAPVSALCGKCVKSRCAVTANGEVYPCVFSRSFSVGNVLTQDIGSIITGHAMQATVRTLSQAFAERGEVSGMVSDKPCDPLDCDPNAIRRRFRRATQTVAQRRWRVANHQSPVSQTTRSKRLHTCRWTGRPGSACPAVVSTRRDDATLGNRDGLIKEVILPHRTHGGLVG